jgi:hypothetical protein
MSSSQRTRHIHIRYFFVAHHAASGDVAIRFCPIKELVADFFTKPLQANTFRQFRKLILNLSDADDDQAHDVEVHRSVLGEQVANVSDPDDREEYSNDREFNTNAEEESSWIRVTSKNRKPK